MGACYQIHESYPPLLLSYHAYPQFIQKSIDILLVLAALAYNHLRGVYQICIEKSILNVTKETSNSPWYTD